MSSKSALARNIAVLTVALTLLVSGTAKAEPDCWSNSEGTPGQDDYIQCSACQETRDLRQCPFRETCTSIVCVDAYGIYEGYGCERPASSCAN